MEYLNAVTQPSLIDTLTRLIKTYPSLLEYAVELLRDEKRTQRLIYNANWRVRLYWDWWKSHA
jgi:hypothetical protein